MRLAAAKADVGNRESIMLTASRALSNLFFIKTPLFAQCRQPFTVLCKSYYEFSIKVGRAFFNAQIYRNNNHFFGNTGYNALFAEKGKRRRVGWTGRLYDRIMNL